MCAVEPSSVLVSVGGNWGFRWITWKTSQWENVIIDDVCNRRWVWVDVASVKISAWCIFLWVICKFSAIIAHWVKLLTEIRIFLSQIKVIFCFLQASTGSQPKSHFLPALLFWCHTVILNFYHRFTLVAHLVEQSPHILTATAQVLSATCHPRFPSSLVCLCLSLSITT